MEVYIVMFHDKDFLYVDGVYKTREGALNHVKGIEHFSIEKWEVEE